jgi:hypothetical protein
MAQHTTEPPLTSRRSNTASGVIAITAALMVGLTPVATSGAAAKPFARRDTTGGLATPSGRRVVDNGR